MKNLNIQINDIAAINTLGGSALADIIAAQYEVIGDTRDTTEITMPCIAFGQTHPSKHWPWRFHQPRVLHGQSVTECHPALRAV